MNATELVSLHIFNEEGLLNYWTEQAQSVRGSDYPNARLQDILKDEFEESWPEIRSGSVWEDLMGWALQSVSWYEVAGELIDYAESMVDDEEDESEVNEPDEEDRAYMCPRCGREFDTLADADDHFHNPLID